MYISYNWLKELVDFNCEPAELDHILTMLGIEVESIIDYTKKYDKFIVAEVLEKETHPNADKLSVCLINTGAEKLTVVCGGPNVAKGQKIVLGLVGAVVPSNGLVLEKRVVRKIESNGMICSQVELEIGDDHSGIWVLPDEAAVGTKLSDYLNLNDIVFEISVTPNRADCLSHFGIAREIAAYFNQKVNYPEIKLNESQTKSSDYIKIRIEDKAGCPRYTGRVVRNVKIGESPDWLKQRLILLGMRPINIAVDITNFVLIECGQPLHAFDLDMIAGNEIIVKNPSEGDKFITLDSKERILDSSMVMICDGEKPVAIGGVMGGENSEITLNTKNVLIEAAYFNPPSVRKTAKKLGISSESSYRFERGVDIDNLLYASNRAAQMLADYAGGEIQKEIIDVYPEVIEPKTVKLRFERANKIIGSVSTAENIKDIFIRLGFDLLESDLEQVLVKIPAFRVDISEEIDLVEEIARLNNYDNLDPQFVSSVTFDRDRIAPELASPSLRARLRNYLVENGFNEILTQNITDPVSAKHFDEEPVLISNPLGEELSVMRTSLVPSMLKTIERNLRLGNSDLRFYEVGWTFHNITASDNTFIDGLKEQEELIISLTGKAVPLQWGSEPGSYDFYDIKGLFENLTGFFKFKGLKLVPNKDEKGVFSKNSLAISYKGEIIGALGEISSKYLAGFDIETKVFVILLNLNKLYAVPVYDSKYSPVAPFPGSRRDLAFIVDKTIAAGELISTINSCDQKILKSTDLFDLYEGKSIDQGKKSLAFSLYFSSAEKTLTDIEIESVINKIVETVEKKFAASLRK